MKNHEAGEQITFTAQYPVRFCGRDYGEGDEQTIILSRDWLEDDGLGSGGPWGWGGYSSSLVADLSGYSRPGHAHTCAACCKEIEYSMLFDCDGEESDHADCLCDACVAEAVDLNAG